MGTRIRGSPESSGNLEPSEINSHQLQPSYPSVSKLRPSSELSSSYTSSLSSATQVLTLAHFCAATVIQIVNYYYTRPHSKSRPHSFRIA